MGGAVANEHPAFVWQPPLPKYLACTEFLSYILQQGTCRVGKGKVTVARSCCGAVLGYCERPCIRATLRTATNGYGFIYRWWGPILGAKVVTIKVGYRRLGQLQAIPHIVIGRMLYRSMPQCSSTRTVPG